MRAHRGAPLHFTVLQNQLAELRSSWREQWATDCAGKNKLNLTGCIPANTVDASVAQLHVVSDGLPCSHCKQQVVRVSEGAGGDKYFLFTNHRSNVC